MGMHQQPGGALGGMMMGSGMYSSGGFARAVPESTKSGTKRKVGAMHAWGLTFDHSCCVAWGSHLISSSRILAGSLMHVVVGMIGGANAPL